MMYQNLIDRLVLCQSVFFIMYRSKKYPWMLADVDRLVAGEDAGLECKTASAYSADKWADGNIPLHYVMQCYHYMAVTGKRSWYIAAVILGKGFKVCDEIIESYFPKAKKKETIALVGFDEKLRRREEILGFISELQEEQKQIEQEVKMIMQEHEMAGSERYQVSWKNIESTKLDTKRIKAEQPKLYQEYGLVSHYRRKEM